MACAVRSCRNQMLVRKDLSFFQLPKQHHLKDEWLEILGIEPGATLSNIRVCELHFKPKDFCTTKKAKQLKTHAIPVMNLGKGKSESVDSEDEFMEYDSGEEIVEVPVQKQTKKEPEKKEQEIEEVEEGRRPSRRAAREAAKKIYNSVRNFMPRGNDDDAFSPTATAVSTASPQLHAKQRRRSVAKPGPPVSIELAMECHEEILSPAQAEALLKAQLEYNMVMKTLRSLKAQNVRIICSKEPYSASTQPPTTTVLNTTPKATNNSPIVINVPAQKSSIVPIVLSSNSLSITKTSPAVA